MISIENFTCFPHFVFIQKTLPERQLFQALSAHCTPIKIKMSIARMLFFSRSRTFSGTSKLFPANMSKVFQFLIVLGILCITNCQSAETDVKIRQGKIGFLSGATTLLSSLAQDLISRSAANSQVLSLNLTNLFILLVLKAIIFGAGAFGYGHGGYGRNADGLIKENLSTKINFDEFLSESELLLMLSYLKADSTQKFGCLQRVACEDPRKAKEYVFTGKLILKGSEIFTKSSPGTKYDSIITHLEDAISYGLKGQDCAARYQCEES